MRCASHPVPGSEGPRTRVVLAVPPPSPPRPTAHSSVSVKLVFATRAKCQDFVARYKDDGLPLQQLSDPSSALIQLSLSVNPNPLKTKRLENNLRLCGKNWLTNSKFSSQMEVAPLGSGQTFTLVAPDLCSCIPVEVLQRILSQANKVNV